MVEVWPDGIIGLLGRWIREDYRMSKRRKCKSRQKQVPNKVTRIDFTGVKSLYQKFCETNYCKSRLGFNNEGF